MARILELLLMLAFTIGTAAARDQPYTHIQFGPADISLGGEYRLRGEYDNNFDIKKYAPENDDDFVLSRLRFDVNAAFTPAFKTVFQFQDARVFGSAFDDADFSSSNPYHDNMDIRQAYIDYKMTHNLAFKLGRQQIGFGDNRIFGPGNWGNIGRYVWDAVQMQFSNSWMESHTLFGRYIISDPDRWPNKHADGPTAYANYTMLKNLPVDVDLFYVLKSDTCGETIGESGVGNLSCHSAGFALDDTLNQWD
ncbi:MAG: hypothetical protein COX19_02770 [Desulfobacterales bacterium CG23_combo_of_CG06-09_8_20_14_all_51_8]|nr:MAG: hypothetical protein COX19_02770 [Desulfobacterales bacterium CG23_combo_of_CG06-09_8_20_14_all_51_8]